MSRHNSEWDDLHFKECLVSLPVREPCGSRSQYDAGLSDELEGLPDLSGKRMEKKGKLHFLVL